MKVAASDIRPGDAVLFEEWGLYMCLSAQPNVFGISGKHYTVLWLLGQSDPCIEVWYDPRQLFTVVRGGG